MPDFKKYQCLTGIKNPAILNRITGFIHLFIF